MAKDVLVVGTSPRRKGNSNILAQAFAEGAEQVGNNVEFLPLASKDIGFCVGCLEFLPLASKDIGFCVGCWGCLRTKSCVVNHDKAEEAVQKIRDADVVAFATPIYYYEMSGQMKTLLDRTNCLYTAGYRFRDVYLLITAESTDPHTPEHAVGGLQRWLKVFKKAQLKGVVFAGGAADAGAVQGHPEVEQARVLGSRV